MSPSLRITVSLCLLLLLSACGTTPKGNTQAIHSDFVPAGSLRVAQVFYVATRAEFVSGGDPTAYNAVRASGIADEDLVDGTIVAARIYCCGGPTRESSSEYANRRVLYVPKHLKLQSGDFVEFKVGRPSVNDDGGRPNTVIRVVAKQGDQPERCWWDPRNDRLWGRVVYCDWMSAAGWVKQGGISPAWHKPAP